MDAVISSDDDVESNMFFSPHLKKPETAMEGKSCNLPIKVQICEVHDYQSTHSPTWTMNLCSSSKVTISLLTASLINTVFCTTADVPSHLWTIAWTMISDVINLDLWFLNFSTDLSAGLPALHQGICIKRQNPFEGSCIYAELKLHTGGLYTRWPTDLVGNCCIWFYLDERE